MSQEIKEIEVAKNDTVSAVRHFYNLPKNQWTFVHKIMNTMVFQKKIIPFPVDYVVDENGQEIPIKHISRFTIFHKYMENGLKIRAYVKPEYCTVKDVDNYEVVKKGVYENHVVYNKKQSGVLNGIEISNDFFVLGKNNPKRDKLMKYIDTYGQYRQKHHGINAGTPIAQSWTARWKELRLE